MCAPRNSQRLSSASQIIGCQVRREPPDSTERYTRWINQLAPEQLLTQVLVAQAGSWPHTLESTPLMLGAGARFII